MALEVTLFKRPVYISQCLADDSARKLPLHSRASLHMNGALAKRDCKPTSEKGRAIRHPNLGVRLERILLFNRLGIMACRSVTFDARPGNDQ